MFVPFFPVDSGVVTFCSMKGFDSTEFACPRATAAACIALAWAVVTAAAAALCERSLLCVERASAVGATQPSNAAAPMNVAIFLFIFVSLTGLSCLVGAATSTALQNLAAAG